MFLSLQPHAASQYSSRLSFFLPIGRVSNGFQFDVLDPDFFAGLVNLAGTLLSVGRCDEALKVALHSLALRPGDAFSNSQIGRCYYYLRRFSEAEIYFKKVLELDPIFANPPMLYLVRISLIKHREDDAQEYIRLFLKLHPNSPDAPYWTGILQSLASGSMIQPPVIAAQKQGK